MLFRSSQVSPGSILALPHPGQSASVVGPQATLLGQNVSAGPQVRCVREQEKVQLAVLPARVTMVLASLTQAADALLQAATGSHVSPASMMPLPQLGAQSLSLRALHPAGQHWSLLAQAVTMPPSTHCTSQVCALPDGMRS